MIKKTFKSLKSQHTLSVFTILAIGFIQNCGVVSDVLDNNSENSSTKVSKQSRSYQQVKVSYEDMAPNNFAEPWSRKVLVSSEGQPIKSVIVEVMRYRDNKFTLIGTTSERGLLVDTDISKHTKYRIGGQIVTDWKPAKRDLLWTEKYPVEQIIADFEPLNTDKETTVILSQIHTAPITIEAVRIKIARGENVAWNRVSPLNIRTTSLHIDGTLNAFSSDCASGLSAPELSITATVLSGSGDLNWSGCTGVTGAKGRQGKAGKRGYTGSTGGTGGNGGLIKVYAEKLEIDHSQLISKGGLGGLGGPGGQGGPGKREEQFVGGGGMIGGYDVPPIISYGKPGKTGITGANGKPGKDGDVRLTIKNQM
jgi:hypothetical protein